jgi:hypothetical protein
VTTPAANQHSIDEPRISVPDVQRLAAAHLSLPSRMGHVVLLLVSLLMAVAVGSLWATEPSLPPRTQAAFALMVGIAIAWAMFAAWVLARRRVLFGADRVLAATMGLTFSVVGTLGLTALGYWGALGSGAYLGAVLQLGLAGAAAVLLVRARRRVADLSRRRQALDSQRRGGPSGPPTGADRAHS